MVIILDRQHYGKPGQNDLGAGADLDGDGRHRRIERLHGRQDEVGHRRLLRRRRRREEYTAQE